MFRVIALGLRAGVIVDRLRANKKYDDIRFVYCNSDNDRLMHCGTENDEHIFLSNIPQCREAIHADNEQMAVLVTCLGQEYDNSREYAADIISELWNYADRTYCFATIPFFAAGKRTSAIEIFNSLTYWSDISVLQDDIMEPYGFFPLDMDNGLVRFLDLVLSHPRKGRSSRRDKLPFGVWATEKQLWMALNAMYSNNMPQYYNAGTFTFHKKTHEQ